MTKTIRSVFLLLCLLLLPTAILAQPKVLILHANPADRALDVQAKLQGTGDFSAVDIFDMDNATGLGTVPTLAQLQAYDAIITFTNYGPLTGVGDVIGQYIDGGGGVVNGVFSIINDYRGLYTSSTYEALVPGNAVSGTELTLGTVPLPSHPIMNGVTSFDGGTSSFKSDATTLEPGAYVVANWSDGTPLIVAKENVGPRNAKIVDLNFFLPSTDVPAHSNYWVASTDGAQIMANALLWVVPPPPAELSVQPHSLDLGSQFVGSSNTQCITIKDAGPNKVGATPLHFLSISLAGNPDFTIVSGGTQADMTPGQSGSICIRFSPLANGNRTATLTVTTNGRDSGTQTVTLTGSGIAPGITVPVTSLFKQTRTKLGSSRTQSFLVSSIGQGPLTITGASIVGMYANQYSVTRLPSAPIPSGTSDTVSITYSPTFEGSRPAILILTSNGLNHPIDTVGLYGTGTLPRLVVSPSPLNFDSVGIGQQSCESLTLYNPGTDTVFITRNFFTSRDVDFTMTPLVGNDTILPPEKTKQITVCFNPVRNGLRMARISLTTTIPKTFEVPSRDTSSFFINIIGEGVPYGSLAVGGTSVVDSAIVGTQLCLTDTFFNTGTADLVITAASLTGTNAAEYSLTGLVLPLTIRAGEFHVFSLCATPGQRGDRSAFLNLTASTGGKQINSSLPLDVFGQIVCASATPLSAFTTKTCVGTTDTAVITVNNCGDVAAVYTAALASAAPDYKIVGSANSANTAAGASAQFTVTFTPTTVGSQNVNLNITAPNGISQPVTLTGVGQAATIAGSGTADSTHMNQTSKPFNVTVKNTGECDWTPGTPTASDAQFTYVSGGSTPIAAGATGTLSYTFTPSAQGMQSATLSFPAAAGVSIPSAAVTVNGYGLPVEGVERVAEAGGFALKQNYPNPFNPTTEIRFVLPKESNVRIDIIDVTGKLVRTVVNARYTAGEHGTVLDASSLASGVYYYQLTAGTVVLTRQMVLSK